MFDDAREGSRHLVRAQNPQWRRRSRFVTISIVGNALKSVFRMTLVKKLKINKLLNQIKSDHQMYIDEQTKPTRQSTNHYLKWTNEPNNRPINCIQQTNQTNFPTNKITNHNQPPKDQSYTRTFVSSLISADSEWLNPEDAAPLHSLRHVSTIPHFLAILAPREVRRRRTGSLAKETRHAAIDACV